MRSPALKRLMDLLGASVLLILFALPMAAVAVFVRLTMGSPVLFRQERPGWRGKPFMMVKFRSMADLRDADGNLLPDEQRLNAVGKFLRSTSMDELPELFNVLRGEMSLVGPRPLLMRYLPLYSPEQFRRHEVRPGITGWSQVNGRNAVSWDKRFAQDVWYVDHWTLGLDLKILFLTLVKVVRREGVSPKEQVIMSEFKGDTS